MFPLGVLTFCYLEDTNLFMTKWMEELRLQGEVERTESEYRLESTLTLNKLTEVLLSNLLVKGIRDNIWEQEH